MASFFDNIRSNNTNYHVKHTTEEILFDTVNHDLHKNGLFLIMHGHFRERGDSLHISLADLKTRHMTSDCDVILYHTTKIGYPFDPRICHPVEAKFYMRCSWLENHIEQTGDPENVLFVNTVLMGKNAGKMFIVNYKHGDDTRETDGVWTQSEYTDLCQIGMSNWQGCVFLDDENARRANEICMGIVRADQLRDWFDSDSDDYSSED